MPRELSKCREWEKDRRDRLNRGFAALGKVLPCYDPSLPLSKINILEKAASYIEELQDKVKDLLSTESVNKVERDEVKKLYERTKKLILRNEQLANLLKDAGIRVPSECGKVKKFKKPKHWSNRISPEQVKLLAEKENQKESNVDKPKVLPKKSKPKLKITKPAAAAKQKRRKAPAAKKVATSKCVIIFSQPVIPSTQSCYIITNAPSSKHLQPVTKNTTVVTNSTLLSAPLVTATIKSTLTPKTNTALPPLGPGTLILANGSIVPVLPPPTAIIPQNPTIIANAPAPLLLNQQTVVVVTTATQASTKSFSFVSRSLAYIKPKRCTTKTVQANKVPIPALTSRYANSCIVFNGQNGGSATKEKTQPKKSEKQAKVEKVGDKKAENSEAPKRKLDESVDDVAAAKQQRVEESGEKNKRTESSVVEKEGDDTRAVEITEDKTEQKKVTAYSIDSICKEREENVAAMPAANAEVDSSTKPCENLNKTEVAAVQQQVEQAPVDITGNVPAQPSKLDEIPDNVLKEIENSETNKTEKADDAASKALEISLPHSELSNDIFASLQVAQSGGQNPESTSPTAAFLLAFPLVSTLTGVKVSEVIEEDNSDSQRGTPTLLQIGTMDTTKPTQTSADNLTPSLLNLDNFSFFSSKDICSSFYQPFDTFSVSTATTTTVSQAAAAISTCATSEKSEDKRKGASDANKNIKVVYDPPTTKERGFPFVNKSEMGHQKSNQPFSSHQGCVRAATTESSNKDVGLALEKSITTQENTRVHNQNPAADLSAAYNSYNVNHTLSVYNAVDAKQSQKSSKCSMVNSYNATAPRTSQTVTQCNTFNPFAETVRYTAVSCYNPVTKPYIDSLYSNPSSYNYNYCQSDVGVNQGGYSAHKNLQRADDKPYYNNSYNADARSNVFSNNYCQMHNKDKFGNQVVNKNKTASNQSRPPVNWMTTPDIRHQTAPNNDYLLPCFVSKDLENSVYPTAAPFSVPTNTQTTYFNTNTSIYPTPELTYSFPDAKKSLDSTFPHVSGFQRSDLDDNQLTWSPTKLPQLLDPAHAFVSSALPTLVGDLALGNTPSAEPGNKSKDPYHRQKEIRRSKPASYDSHVNFLSVSQLVDHKGEAMPARTASRRNSGNRPAKPALQKSVKRKDGKESYHAVPGGKMSDKKQQVVQNYNLQHGNQDWISEASKQTNKNPSSSYSAEALIGQQPLSEDVAKQRNNSGQCGYSAASSLPVSFLTDNIIPYFPPVELQQEASTFVQNQNCQNNSFSHNFSSVQSNTYSSGSLISSTANYLPTANFMSDIGTHDYNPIISENMFPPKTCMKTGTLHKQASRQEERKVGSACGASFSKKPKKKHSSETNVPGFVDFSFLSMPAAINSPILPDDFHANLLAPPTPQLYPCKNPLYPKQNPELNAGALLPLPPVPVSRGNIQHPEISPSVNNGGTSLTNFNLSTIFPEINKGTVPLPDVYPDPSKVREYNSHKNYVNTTQVSYTNNKSTTYGAPIYSFSNT